MGFGKALNSFKILFLIKKYNIRLIYLQNLAAFRHHYLGREIAKSGITNNLRYFFFRLRKLITYGLLKVLIFLNLFSRIDIYFE